jgi:hypothetical protein
MAMKETLDWRKEETNWTPQELSNPNDGDKGPPGCRILL